MAASAVPGVYALSVGPGIEGTRLDKWLAQAVTRYSRAQLQRWIEAGRVQVNGAPAHVRHAVYSGDQVVFEAQALPAEMAFTPEPGAIDIVFEDDELLVVNKPVGLVVHPAAGNWSGTLLNRLLQYAPALGALPRAGIVHRLDKDTSGLMVVAKTASAQTDLVRQLQTRTVKREYLAVVHGAPGASGTVDAPIGRDPRERTRMAVLRAGSSGAKPAVTHFERLALSVPRAGPYANLALLACRLETGRTHQIRVHLQSIGLPLFGDAVYRARGARDPFERQALHAWRLGLLHPESRRECAFSAPPPGDLLELFAACAFDLSSLSIDASIT